MTDEQHDEYADKQAEDRRGILRLVPSPPSLKPLADDSLHDLIKQLQRPEKRRVPSQDEPPNAA